MEALRGRKLNVWRKSLMTIAQECCEQYWTSSGGNTPQNSSCTATYQPSQKLFKWVEPEMWNTAGEVRTNSLAIDSWGPLHMDEQRQNDQLEPTYNSFVPIQDITLKTYRERWTTETGGVNGLRRWWGKKNESKRTPQKSGGRIICKTH